MTRFRWITLILLVVASAAWPQQGADFETLATELPVEGWKGFSDFAFLRDAFFTLTLATVLGAIIAYHPRYTRGADTFEELEAPKVYIMYAVIGALIGIMVVKYGLVIGFVLFGIGGLIRFRTVLRSAQLTGHVILVTLIGLSAGLELPHVAVLATVFGFVLIYALQSRITYRIDVRALGAEAVAASATAYRKVLEEQNCRILSEKKNPEKGRVSFIFSVAPSVRRSSLEEALDSGIDTGLRGSLNWEID